ncbi:uncharacterized protein EI90DRAFT_3121002 [Cantharellus anzutake]|uniref:uncharacterized protein n=1 Tax=Cantharellus anzutake TaxID=1750568 RepID=UPI00190557F1|nr:uncharacterized protein EI90DRAFT_3121002 [Cantharellus anzutake]KAF8334594.1 hypothetical protein EI90DRAFT_3121002 [Cantharellus anzutake]
METLLRLNLVSDKVGKFAPPPPTSHPIQGFPPPPPEVSAVPPLDSEDTSMSGESSFVEQAEAVPPATLTTRCFPAAQCQHMAAAEDDGAGPSTNPQANMPGPSTMARKGKQKRPNRLCLITLASTLSLLMIKIMKA